MSDGPYTPPPTRQEQNAYNFGKRNKPPPKVETVHTPESAVVNATIRWLYTHKIFFWRNNTGAWKPEGGGRAIRYGYPGSSDILAIQPGTGRLLCLEAKSSVGHQTEAQIAFQKSVEAAGAFYLIVRSVDDLEAHKADILGRGT